MHSVAAIFLQPNHKRSIPEYISCSFPIQLFGRFFETRPNSAFMDSFTAIHVAITVLTYQLRIILVMQMLLLWYVDVLGRIFQRAIQLTKASLKPVESAGKVYELATEFDSSTAIDRGIAAILSTARREALHLLKEFHMLPLKLQELELVIFSALRYVIIASQGSVFMQPLPPSAATPLNKPPKNALKWKLLLGSAEKTVVAHAEGERQHQEAISKKWMPSKATATGPQNGKCEVNTVNSSRSHILPSPRISEAYADELTSLTPLKEYITPAQLPTAQGLEVDNPNEFLAKGPDGNAWNLLELKGLWVDRKRLRKEDVSDKELLRSMAESTSTQHF